MQLTIIIPCFNAAALIDQQLAALAAEQWGHSWEVLVADNGSTDNSRAVAESYADRVPGLRVVDAAGTKGPAHARNIGAREARGRALAFVDADDVIAPGWVAAIGDAVAEHGFVASRFDIERLNPEWVVRSRPNSQGGGLQKVNYPPFLPHAGGCGLAVRRELFEAAGGFDESLPYLEDTDFCFRVQLAGTPLAFAPDALIYIRYRDTPERMFRQARIWARYNVYLARKYATAKAGPREMARGWLGLARRWRRLLVSRPAVSHMAERALWRRRCGWLLGVTVGSVIERIPPPQI